MTKKAFKAVSKLAVLVALLVMVVSLCGLITACNKDDGAAISLDVTEKTTYVADIFRLTATTKDPDADVTWTSSNDKVATVKKGSVTGVAVGEATITASLDDGASASCVVTVLDRTVTISEHTKAVNYEELGDDKTITLTATCSSGEAVTWTSSDTSVATVANGVVTFSKPGAREAQVTITAQKGAAFDDCVITVTSPSIPEDYYRLAKATNAEVIEYPGKWYYHADGSLGAQYHFADEPAYGNGELSAELDIFPALSDNKYFRFRYQPDFEEGTKYTFKFTIKVNIDGKIGFGTNTANGGVQSQSVQANVAKNMVYIGTVNTGEPFHININQVNGEITGNVSFLITNISVKEYVAGDENQIEEELPEVVVPEEYDLERGTADETCNNPGKWYYMIDPVSAGSVDYTEAKYDHGVVTLALAEELTGQYHQLRIRPAFLGGTKVTATFTVSLSAPGTIYYALNNENNNRGTAVFGSGDGETAVGTELTLTRDFVVSSTAPFVIWVEPAEGTGALTLTVKNAKFEERLPAKYTVTYDSKGGSAVEAATVNEGEAIQSAPAAPTYAGHVFGGWYATEDCSGEAVVFPYTPAASVTLYAKWLDVYTVTYDSKGGDAVEAATVTEGNSIAQLPTPTRDGFTFIGWYDAEEDGNKITAPYTPEASVTLYAYWASDEVTTYTVTFETNGGSAIQAQTVTEGESVTLTEPTKEGYVFGGWYENDGLTQEVTGETYTPAADATLYAKWLNVYTVSFDVNHNGSAAIESKKVTEGNSVTLEEISRKAFSFDGWFENEDLTGTAVDLTYTPSANVTLHAKWTARTEYTIDQEPDKDSALAMHNRDAWYYELNGNQSAATVETASYNNGTVTFAVTGAVEGNNGQHSLRLAYAPDLAKGTKYTLTFKVTVNVDGKYKGSTLGESANFQSVVMSANTPTTVTYSGVVGTEAYYFNFYNTTAASDVTITVTDITAEEYVAPTSYEIVMGLNSAVKANQNTWYYYVGDGKVETHFSPAPEYDNGVITMNCTAMEAAAYQLRYMPCATSDKKDYTVTFTLNIDSAYDVMSVFSTNAKDVQKTDGANGEIIVTCTYSHQSDVVPFYIQFQPKEKVEQAVNITVSDISFVEV